MKRSFIVLFFSVILCLVGCTFQSENVKQENVKQVQTVNVNPEVINPINLEPISRTDSIYTVDRKVALTFNGLPSIEKLEEVLQLLNEYNIKATFFVPGMKAAEEPYFIDEIITNGHEVESNTLYKKSMSDYDYDQIYTNLALSKSAIEKIVNRKVKYVRADGVQADDFLLKAAKQTEHERYIGYNVFLKDSLLDEQLKSPKDLRGYITRGAIIAIDLEKNEKIAELLALLVPAVQEVKYDFVTIENLLLSELPKKPYSEIEGYDLVKKNAIKNVANYNLFYKGNNQKKQVNLTFDDWGTDYTVTSILDILKEKNVVATFFIRANGAERNPNLARAMLEEGHEIANHTYSHPVITTISDEEIQDEVVRTHYVLTEALQQPPALYFRPPTGAFNEEAIKSVVSTGYTNIAMYDVTALDWEISKSAEDIYNLVTTKSTSGSIILLHMLDNINTLEALPNIIDYFLEEGYTFVNTTDIIK